MKKNTNTTERALTTLRNYVNRVNYGGTFDTNTLRARLRTVNGLKPNQLGSVIGTAVRRGIITKIGETASTNPLHNSGRVGIYTRG